jgi:hypothetical protein
MTGKVDSVSHSSGSSTVKLQGSDVTVSGSLVLDATGHSRRLVQFDKKFDPGYQGAYGIIAGGLGCKKVDQDILNIWECMALSQGSRWEGAWSKPWSCLVMGYQCGPLQFFLSMLSCCSWTGMMTTSLTC